MPSPVLAATTVDALTFAVAAAIVLIGAIGVVVSRNPVHSALMLVMTLFGVAVLFVEQQANFLAAVQVIVYAGAIVVLFLFVIMFLGVDREESLEKEPLRAQRPLAVVLTILGLAGLLLMGFGAHWSVGARSVAGPARNQPGGNVATLGRSVFTTYLFAFEITSALLVIAVVGAVVLARRPGSALGPPEAELDASPPATESGTPPGDDSAESEEVST
jgi:NADH-quinone oxidoreductase subunit J